MPDSKPNTFQGSTRETASLLSVCGTWRGRIVAAVALAAFASVTAAVAQTPPQPTGAPAAAGKKTEDQLETDWVDGRWNQTDVGPFLASSLRTPGGLVAKALSVRVGEQGEAAVCYDTGAPSLRGAWSGGFLRFDEARFGLVRPPAVAGQWQFTAGPDAGWRGLPARHEALRVNGDRVVLYTRVGEMLVRESPWFERHHGAGAFTRTLEIPPGRDALTLRFAPAGRAVAQIAAREGRTFATVANAEKTARLALRADSGARLVADQGAVDLVIAPREQTLRLKLFIAADSAGDAAAFERLVSASPPPENLAELSRPGGARWLPALTTRGQVGFPADGFALDTLTMPYVNPWKALFFCSGVDFFCDGSAAVSTIHGDVWRVSGLDAKLGDLKWKRYATGLFQPLGLRVVDDRVYVLGRDQITRLHDENADGEADLYENFYNGIATKPGHDYVACLERDAAGNFYFIDPQGVHRVSADGKSDELLASGLRNPNGLGAGPTGVITATPQQGTWTPSSAIVEVKRGGFYGFGGPQPTTERPDGRDPALCWLPHTFDNSSSSQVWVPAGRWGALGGQMLHFSWGRCALMLVLRDAAANPPQGAAVRLPVRFLSGPMRGTFHPTEGALYVACSTGWQTSATKDGALQRVRFTGAAVRAPVAWRAHANGLALTFAQSLDRATATDAGSYGARQWNYRYSENYGSKDYSPGRPGQEGRDEVEIRAAKLSADGRTVFLEMPGLKPVMQMELNYNVSFASGQLAQGPLVLTLNRLDGSFAEPPSGR